METLDYFQAEREAVDFISQNNKMVLATCSDNRVTARMISIINDGMRIFCQTDRNFIKYRQITENPNVALSAGNIQIEGIAKITGHPFENRFFNEAYKLAHRSSYETYSHLKDEVVIEITPHLVTFWKYSDGQKPYRDFIDIKKHAAFREYYETNSKEVTR